MRIRSLSVLHLDVGPLDVEPLDVEPLDVEAVHQAATRAVQWATREILFFYQGGVQEIIFVT